MELTAENYNQGFLVDEELLGGITSPPNQPGIFVAYVLKHSTGEYLGYQPYPDLRQALDVLNQVQRDWKFEAISGCGGGQCGPGKCKGTGCRQFGALGSV